MDFVSSSSSVQNDPELLVPEEEAANSHRKHLWRTTALLHSAGHQRCDVMSLTEPARLQLSPQRWVPPSTPSGRSSSCSSRLVQRLWLGSCRFRKRHRWRNRDGQRWRLCPHKWWREALSPCQDVEDDRAAHQEGHRGGLGLAVHSPQQQHQGDQAGHGDLREQGATHGAVRLQHGERRPVHLGVLLPRRHGLVASESAMSPRVAQNEGRLDGCRLRSHLGHGGAGEPSEQLAHQVRDHQVQLQTPAQVDGQGERRVEMGTARMGQKSRKNEWINDSALICKALSH